MHKSELIAVLQKAQQILKATDPNKRRITVMQAVTLAFAYDAPIAQTYASRIQTYGLTRAFTADENIYYLTQYCAFMKALGVLLHLDEDDEPLLHAKPEILDVLITKLQKP